MYSVEKIKVGPNGDIINADIHRIKRIDADKFCQVYLRDNDEFFKLSKAEMNVLAVCWQYSLYYDDDMLQCPGNKILFDAQMRDLIKEKTGLAMSSIKNSMVSLVNKDMLIKDDKYKQVYYLNPKYFFKGQVSKRTKAIRVYTEYILSDLA